MRVRTRTWRRDLEAVHKNEQPFKCLMAHKGLIEKLVQPWWGRYRQFGFLCFDDLKQEAWIAVLRAVRSWQPERDPNISGWVERSVNLWLLRLGHDYSRTSERDSRFLRSMLAEEKVIRLAPTGDPSERKYEAVSQPVREDRLDVERMVEHMLDTLTLSQATLIKAVVRGDSVQVAANDVYGSHCKHPRKAALRAIAAAHAVVKCSAAHEER